MRLGHPVADSNCYWMEARIFFYHEIMTYYKKKAGV